MRPQTKILVVIGTRPEAIKLAPVVHELKRRADRFDVSVCVTGQHGDMVHPILDLTGVEVDHDLALMRPQQELTDVTVGVLLGLQRVIQAEQPDWTLVQGDTTTAMAGSVASFYHGVPVGHVEAGLRTYDIGSPFPEEFNRRVAAVTAQAHFAPTDWSAENLRRESVPDDAIHVTGNTVIDCFKHVADLPFDPTGTPLAEIPFGERQVVLVTAHRRENHGERLEDICFALKQLVESHEDLHLVFPVHPNPRVQQPVTYYLGDLDRVTLTPPLDYQPLVWLLSRCQFLITDSGGLQEEATGVGKPVLVLRDSTERPEGVSAGSARLVGASPARITTWADLLLTDPGLYEAMACATSPYGTGEASEAIVDVLAGSPEPARAGATDATLERTAA